MITVYLMRHAKSEANVDLIYGTDSPISKNGERQAKVGAAELGVIPDIVISGRKKCQIQTAQIMFPDIYKYDEVKEFDEINFGVLEGKKIDDELRDELLNNPSYIKKVYSGDNVWTRAKEAIAYIEKLGRMYSDKTILIISSKAMIQSIICELIDGEINGLAWTGKYYLRNCDYYMLEVSDRIETISKGNMMIRIN